METQALSEEHYKDLADKPFFPSLVQYSELSRPLFNPPLPKFLSVQF